MPVVGHPSIRKPCQFPQDLAQAHASVALGGFPYPLLSAQHTLGVDAKKGVVASAEHTLTKELAGLRASDGALVLVYPELELALKEPGDRFHDALSGSFT